MKSSESINELATALAKAQGEFPAIDRNRTVEVKTKTGGSYTFEYATLDHVLSLVVPILSKHGLSLSGGPDEGVYEGRLLHSSGQWLSGSLAIPPNLDPQDMGSALTYFSRYIVCVLLGIAASQDDDCNAASGNKATTAPRSAPPKPKPVPTMAPGAPVIASATVPPDPLIARFTPTPAYADGTAAIARINACTTTDDLDKLRKAMVAEKLKFSPEEAPMIREASQQRLDQILTAAVASGVARQPREQAIFTCTSLMSKLGAQRWAAMVDGVGGDHKDKAWHQNLDLKTVQALAVQMKEAAK